MVLPMWGLVIGLCLVRVAPSFAVKHFDRLRRAPHSPYRQELISADGFQQYKGKILLGGQKLRGVMDTGSNEFVVLSTKCEGFLCGHDMDQFDAQTSSTYRAGTIVEQEFNYSGGSVYTQEAYDNLVIGPLAAEAVPFWEVTESYMTLMLYGEFSFVAGLGPIPPDARQMTPGSKSKKKQYAILPKALDVQQFSVCLSKEGTDSAGYLTWHDDKHISSPELFHKLHVEDTGHWMVRLTDVRLGNRTIACSQGCGAIPDSGTALLSVPTKSAEAFKDVINQWNLSPDCATSHMESLPRLHFKLDGVDHSLPPESYMGDVFGEAREYLAGARVLSGSCQLRAMRMDMKSSVGDVWILGMPFFREYYSVFVQGSRKEKPVVFTAVADSKCQPSESAGEIRQKERTQDDVTSQLISAKPRVRKMAAPVDVSKLTLMPWLRAAVASGHLEEFGDHAPEEAEDS